MVAVGRMFLVISQTRHKVAVGVVMEATIEALPAVSSCV